MDENMSNNEQNTEETVVNTEQNTGATVGNTGQNLSETTNSSEQHTAGNMSSTEKNWGMFCHLAAFTGFVIPFGNIIAPLIIWIIKKEEFQFVNSNGKESINFQISLMIYFAISFILMFLFIGVFLMIGLGIFEIVAVIMASVKASEGVEYKYPLTIRFIK